MNNAIRNLQDAMQRGESIRPKVGGFPYLAETLRQAGVTRNIWHLPACQSIFLTTLGVVAVQATPLVNGMADVPFFDRDALVKALRRDQVGETTFPQFLESSWRAGVVRYDVDFLARTVCYHGVNGRLRSGNSFVETRRSDGRVGPIFPITFAKSQFFSCLPGLRGNFNRIPALCVYKGG